MNDHIRKNNEDNGLKLSDREIEIPAFVTLEYKKKLEQQQKAKIARKQLVLYTAVVSTILGGITLVKKQFTQPTKLIVREIDIHSGYATTPDGRNISPFLDHDCIVPYDGRNFEERLIEYCREQNIPEEEIVTYIETFQKQMMQDETISWKK